MRPLKRYAFSQCLSLCSALISALKTVCDTTNGAANGGDPPPEQTVLPEAPTPAPTQLPPAPVETPPPAPQPPTQIYEVGSFGSIFAIFNHDKGQSINVCEAGEPLLRGPELPDNLLDLTDPLTYLARSRRVTLLLMIQMPVGISCVMHSRRFRVQGSR
jgi:hypothetical protein